MRIWLRVLVKAGCVHKSHMEKLQLYALILVHFCLLWRHVWVTACQQDSLSGLWIWRACPQVNALLEPIQTFESGFVRSCLAKWALFLWGCFGPWICCNFPPKWKENNPQQRKRRRDRQLVLHTHTQNVAFGIRSQHEVTYKHTHTRARTHTHLKWK